MAVHRGGTSFTCDNQNGCAVTGADGANFTFTPRPGTSTPITGGVRVLGPGSTPATWETYDGNPQNDVVDAVAGYLNAQFNELFDRTTSTPPLGVIGDTGINAGNDATGRAVYGSTDGGLNVFFAGFVRSTTDDNGNPARIRIERVMNADQTDTDEGIVNAGIDPGAELWIADAGDDGTTTSFGGGGSPAATTATSFSLHGANTGYIANGDTITTALPYSTSSITL